MNDKAITELDEASVVNDTDSFVLEQKGTAKRLTGSTLLAFLLNKIKDYVNNEILGGAW